MKETALPSPPPLIDKLYNVKKEKSGYYSFLLVNHNTTDVLDSMKCP